MTMTKAQIAKIKHKEIVRQVCVDKYRTDARYRASLIALVSITIATANVLDECIQDLDKLTQKAYVNGNTRKDMRAITTACDHFMNLFANNDPDNIFHQSWEDMTDMKTFSKHLLKVINYMIDLDEESLLKAETSLQLLANQTKKS